jgi:enoyl-CoA hydratase
VSGSTGSTGSVTTSLDGAVLHVLIDRPERRNAIDLAAMERIAEIFEDAADDDRVRAVLVSGAGTTFSAGGDLGAMQANTVRGGAYDAASMAATERAITAVTAAPVPVVAAVTGAAAGVGASLALACDLVVAAPSAYFLLPFLGVGLMPDGGATATVAAAVGRARAMRLALLGEPLPAREALAAGLIAEVAPGDTEALATAHGWAQALAAGPRDALAATKAAINAATLPGLGDALRREGSTQLGLLAAADHAEGAAAFLEHRRPVFGPGDTSTQQPSTTDRKAH